MERVSTPEPTPGAIARLSARLAAGEEAAFREFHDQYFDRLYHFLLVVARGQEHEAREALQQTLLRVLRYARIFASEEAFWDWLKVLARSAARDAGRKQNRYALLLQKFALRQQAHAPEQSSPEEDRLRAILAETLDELDARDRQLLEDKYLEGTTVKELSAETGLTEKAIESRLLRLRRDMHHRLLRKLESL